MTHGIWFSAKKASDVNSDAQYVLQVTSDHVNNSGTPINTVITFQSGP
jgi:hypothetical protein